MAEFSWLTYVYSSDELKKIYMRGLFKKYGIDPTDVIETNE